jgi:hypothetical protein
MGVSGKPEVGVSCVDLQAVFGKEYRVTAQDGTERKRGKRVDPWNWEIRCARGQGSIQPYGGTRLSVYVDSPSLKDRLRRCPGAEVIQEGDTEIHIAVPVTQHEAVFALVEPCRRRQLSEAAKSQLAGRLKSRQAA